MTVIADSFRDLAGYGDVRAVTFWAPSMRDETTGEFVVTPQPVRIAIDSDGSFTTPDLLPGPVRVRINGRAYDITVPEWETPIRLGPLLAAAAPISPAEEPRAVRNLGGMPGLLFIEPEAFDALSAIDPDTTYFIPD